MDEKTMIDYRPWGYYIILADEPDHKVKRLVVYPGKRLSLQRHSHRSEHWFVLYGRAKATVDEATIILQPGESINIPLGSLHRLENPGDDDFAIVEVQRGDYFGEDDIERFEDDFGRV
ncbi:MAG: phosphomannose isomerase type II C-terminal cupin domain [Candidatus Latescibacterota bacterium]